MLTVTLVACALVAITVAIHSAGLASLLRTLRESHAGSAMSTWSMTWLLIRTTWTMLLIHSIEIAVWALFFLGAGLENAESAFYFSGVTYATIGYGDVVLQKPWRMLAPIEGLTGILMCGLSTGFFFAVLLQMLGSQGRGVPVAGAKE
jgi:hypothetical protein